jgi:CTP-dependent riboflavin kinase
LPSHAPERVGPGFVEFEGVVCSGLGKGARFTTLDWVAEEFRRRLGFSAWPGTLNLKLEGARWRAWRGALAERPGIAVHPPQGFCAAKCFAVVLDDRVRAAAVFPEVAGYPEDQIELVAPVALRAALGLSDGDRVRLRLEG